MNEEYSYIKYSDLDDLNEQSRDILKNEAQQVVERTKKVDFNKYKSLNSSILQGLQINYESAQLMKQKKFNAQKERETGIKGKTKHPITPIRGQIYNALLGENLGSELSGEHPIVIIQNTQGNLFGQKVNVLPIEGDGNRTNRSYWIQITSTDMEVGSEILKKDPSRVVATDIYTIDKARLGKLVGKLNEKKMKEIMLAVAQQLEITKNLFEK